MHPQYKIYWLHSLHCAKAWVINTQPFLDLRTNQVHSIAYVCRHPVVDGKELPAVERSPDGGKSRLPLLQWFLSLW